MEERLRTMEERMSEMEKRLKGVCEINSELVKENTKLKNVVPMSAEPKEGRKRTFDLAFHDDNGVYVSGKSTYDYRDVFRRMGGSWDANRKVWTFNGFTTKEDATNAFQTMNGEKTVNDDAFFG